jgi:hypothetical protein
MDKDANSFHFHPKPGKQLGSRRQQQPERLFAV